MVTRSWSNVALVAEGCRELVPGCPPGAYSLEGSRCPGIEQVVAAGSWVIGLRGAGGLCHFGVCPSAARVVLSLLRCALRALAVGLCFSWAGERRGAWVRSVGWSVPVSGTGVIAPRLRGGCVGGAVAPAFAQALGRPRAPLATCPWPVVPPAAGRPPTLGGRRRMSWMLRLPPGGGPLPVARARLA